MPYQEEKKVIILILKNWSFSLMYNRLVFENF